MSIISESVASVLNPRFWSDLSSDFKTFPGRLESVWQYVLCSALVIVIAMSLQVPLVALSLIMVFFIIQENTVVTLQAGVLFIVGCLAAVLLSLPLYRFAIDYPLLRMFGTVVIVFFSFYFMRISRLGLFGFIIALVVINFQDLSGATSDPELITRGMLWVWVAVSYAAVIAIVVNRVLFPTRPERLFQRESIEQLLAVEDQLFARYSDASAKSMVSERLEKGLLNLHRQLSFVSPDSDDGQLCRWSDPAFVTAIDRLHVVAIQLSILPAYVISLQQKTQLAYLQKTTRNLITSIENNQPFVLQELMATRYKSRARDRLDVILLEMSTLFDSLSQQNFKPSGAAPAVKKLLVSVDAWTNPAYPQFAIKTIIAATACYIFYTATDWRGIQTAMITCLVMALPSLGASSQKGILRVAGCLLGSLAAVIASIFVIPYLDSITGLLMLMLPTIAIGAWVAVGPARSSYVGVQFMYTFALASLGGFGPTINLTEIRDRVIGILIGVSVSIFVSISIWPEREGTRLRALIAKLMQSLGSLTRCVQAGNEADVARLACWTLLEQCREMQLRVALEPIKAAGADGVRFDVKLWLAEAQEILLAMNWLQVTLGHARPRVSDRVFNAFERYKSDVAQNLGQLASAFEQQAAFVAESGNDALDTIQNACAEGSTDEETSLMMDQLLELTLSIDKRIGSLRSSTWTV